MHAHKWTFISVNLPELPQLVAAIILEPAKLQVNRAKLPGAGTQVQHGFKQYRQQLHILVAITQQLHDTYHTSYMSHVTYTQAQVCH